MNMVTVFAVTCKTEAVAVTGHVALYHMPDMNERPFVLFLPDNHLTVFQT